MNLPPTTNPLSMLTLERAAPLFCTQKAISGPFTALGSILLHSKRAHLRGGKRASAISFSIKQPKQKSLPFSYQLRSFSSSLNMHA